MTIITRCFDESPAAFDPVVSRAGVGDYAVDSTGAVPGIAFTVVIGGVRTAFYFPAVPATGADSVGASLGATVGSRLFSFLVSDTTGAPRVNTPLTVYVTSATALFTSATVGTSTGNSLVQVTANSVLAIGRTSGLGVYDFTVFGVSGAAIECTAFDTSNTPGTYNLATTIN